MIIVLSSYIVAISKTHMSNYYYIKIRYTTNITLAFVFIFKKYLALVFKSFISNTLIKLLIFQNVLDKKFIIKSKSYFITTRKHVHI